MAQNLFAMAAQGGISNKPIVEFKAGKMYTSGDLVLRVTPDKRKGLVLLTQAADSLMHLQWKDRTTGTVEDDLIIFPEEAVFKKVTPDQPNTSRIYILEFKTSNKKLFFWMQEPKADKDDDIANKVNQFINNPPSLDSSSTHDLSNLDKSATQTLADQGPPSSSKPASSVPSSKPVSSVPSSKPVSSVPSSKPVSSVPSTSKPSTSVPSVSAHLNAPRQGVNIDTLQSILAGMSVPKSMSEMISAQEAGPKLSSLLDADELDVFLSDPSTAERLLPYLPDGRNTIEELMQTLRTPQFQQAIDSFHHALVTGQAGEMLSQFNLENPDGIFTVDQLIQALQLYSIHTKK